MAASIGGKRRALFTAFETQLGIGPDKLHRLQRLYALRRALITATPETASVSQLMLDSGYSHFGRVAGLYRRPYREMPSVTLLRNDRCLTSAPMGQFRVIWKERVSGTS